MTMSVLYVFSIYMYQIWNWLHMRSHIWLWSFFFRIVLLIGHCTSRIWTVLLDRGLRFVTIIFSLTFYPIISCQVCTITLLFKRFLFVSFLYFFFSVWRFKLISVVILLLIRFGVWSIWSIYTRIVGDSIFFLNLKVLRVHRHASSGRK